MRLVVIALAGCGRLGFEPLALGDAVTEPGVDAAIDTPPGSITVTFGERPNATFTNVTADTMVAETTPALSFGAASPLAVDSDLGELRIGLLRFDLTAIPPDATVLSARLQLWTLNDASDQPVQLFRMLESWDENVASFTLRLAGTAWMHPMLGAGTRATTASGAFTPAAAPPGAFTFGLATGAIAGWVANPAINHGFALIANLGDMDFAASEHPEAPARPLLEVVYLP